MADSTDNIIRERASLLAADAATAQHDYMKAAQVLENAKEQLPQNNILAITEKLGEVYARIAQPDNREYTLKAIGCFEELMQYGFSSQHILQNIAVLYQNIDYFSQASETLDKMQQLYPDSYKVYMQRAFLQIDIQSAYPNQSRNYRGAYSNYSKAEQLYKKSPLYGSDSQMLILQSLISDLRTNGWI